MESRASRPGPARLAALLATAAALGACSSSGGDDIRFTDAAPDGDAATPDARPPLGACRTIADDGATPLGSAVLGTGLDGFEPMPDDLPLHYGFNSAGFSIAGQARISGLDPGDPQDTLAPGNPHTWHHVYTLAGTSLALSPCTRLGYDAVGDAFELHFRHGVILDGSLGPAELFGRQVRVVLEVIDAAGGYATDEKVVTLREPADWADAGPR